MICNNISYCHTPEAVTIPWPQPLYDEGCELQCALVALACRADNGKQKAVSKSSTCHSSFFIVCIYIFKYTSTKLNAHFSRISWSGACVPNLCQVYLLKPGKIFDQMRHCCGGSSRSLSEVALFFMTFIWGSKRICKVRSWENWIRVRYYRKSFIWLSPRKYERKVSLR